MQTVIELGRVARDRKTLPLKVIEQIILFFELTDSSDSLNIFPLQEKLVENCIQNLLRWNFLLKFGNYFRRWLHLRCLTEFLIHFCGPNFVYTTQEMIWKWVVNGAALRACQVFWGIVEVVQKIFIDFCFVYDFFVFTGSIWDYVNVQNLICSAWLYRSAILVPLGNKNM